MNVGVYGKRSEAEAALAREVRDLIRERNAKGRKAVLGLATGRTPVGVYAELVRMHHEEGLDFSGVITFNLDEFEGLPDDHPGSFKRFMREQLFGHINLGGQNIHLLPGNADNPEEACIAYEDAIQEAGGIDLQILGVGLNGHIGFNEPGSARDSRTRRVELHAVTRGSYAESLGCEAPTHALTMGIGTILEARQLRILALGTRKADIVAELLRGEPREEIPASFIQGHADARILVDEAAAPAAIAGDSV